MTIENRGRPAEPQQQQQQSTEPVENNEPQPINDGDFNEISPEELIAGFPEAKLQSLVTKISTPRWVVPVLPEQELECLLNYSIELAKAGIDHECEPCMRFYREGLSTSFIKILTDNAVNSWKYNIHSCILKSCGKLMQLCAIHMKRDNPYLLEMLTIVLDPDNKFNTYNISRLSDQYATKTGTAANFTGGRPWGILDETNTFAKSPPEPRSPRGWLVDLINRFGQFNGFDNLLERFNAGMALLKKPVTTSTTSTDAIILSSSDGGSCSSGGLKSSSTLSLSEDSTKMKLSFNGGSGSSSANSPPLGESNKITLQLIHELLRPFGMCYELLTVPTIEKYFMPIWEVVLELLDGLSDDELKREAKQEARSDSINGIIKSARCLASRLPNQDNLIRDLELFRLKMILKLLKISSFNGKMNALNEINKMLSAVACYSHRTPQQSGGGGGGSGGVTTGGNGAGVGGGNTGGTGGTTTTQCQPADEEMGWLTAERMATWIKENDVLSIVLRDSLHQPQYVEKLEKILRFLINEKSLTLDDLDAVWRAQAGKHEAIVKNVHDLLAKLAWDFNPEHIDHLFDCFEASMTTANVRQRDRLLELIRQLAEEDKNGLVANKVLKLFWQLAHSPDVQQDVIDQALTAHVKILDYSCSQERDNQKSVWLVKCVEELKRNENWVLPALRLIREICCLYEPPINHTRSKIPNRQSIVERLQTDYTLVILVTNSLTTYLERVRQYLITHPDIKPDAVFMDGKYPHPQQIQERLDFLRFLLKDGQLWLCADQAEQIWQCLTVNPAFPSDREECFRWFSKLMGDEPDLDPGINRAFLEGNLLQLDPQLLSESGIKCFERFFKTVNTKERKLRKIRRNYILESVDLIGKDYLWQIITNSSEEISNKAIKLLKEVSTAFSSLLQIQVAELHETFIGECCQRLQTYYDNIIILSKTIDSWQLEHDCDSGSIECADILLRHKEAEKMCRVIRVLSEYIKECDRTFIYDRNKLPLNRSSRGKHINLYFRFTNSGRPIDDIEFTTHSNEMVCSLKRNLLKKLKTTLNNIKVDFYYNNGELIEIEDNLDPIGQYAFRDKTLVNVKLTQISPAVKSSPDSSSDSSTGSPPRPCPNIQRPDSEWTLPGVIISQKSQNLEFFLKLCQLGSDIDNSVLRESCRNLLQSLPMDAHTIRKLNALCKSVQQVQTAQLLPIPLQQQQQPLNANNLADIVKQQSAGNTLFTQQQQQSQSQPQPQPILPTEIPTAESMFIYASPAQVLYKLEVLHALLSPALEPLHVSNLQFESAWVHSGVAHYILNLLTTNNFLPNTDMYTKRAALQNVLKLSKIFLYIVGCVLSKVGNEPTPDFDIGRSQIEILKNILSSTLCNGEYVRRTISIKVADSLAAEMLSADPEGDACRKLFRTALDWQCPSFQTIKQIVQIAWASSCNSLHKFGGDFNDFSQLSANPDQQDHNLCKEALEVLTISLALNPESNDELCRDPLWAKFITSILLQNPMRQIRQSASENLYLICTYCSSGYGPFVFVIKLLVNLLPITVPQYAHTCNEYFHLLCRSLNYGCMFNWPLAINDILLQQEIAWLRSVRDVVKRTGEPQVHEDLLEGHLCLTKELMYYLAPELKSQLTELITEILDDFLFPAARQYLHLRQTGQLMNCNGPLPVCRSSHTIAAACELLVALCQHSIPNMKLMVKNLIDMFNLESEPLREWEYLPPVGPRPFKGFCGLKNAGATCYMNSVLQQLFMVNLIRNGILSASGAANDPNEDFSGECDPLMSENGANDNTNNRNRYHIGILKHVQAIFAHLGHSALQFYIPRGLWSHFKLQGEPVNLREQQDAVEFFMSLFESLDEGLKALGHPQLMGATLGGSFSDQKICQECPHRYSKEEPFSVLSVDIRNHSSLTESLEQYVKGELLEGADAYHCDKCDKKVVTVKRLCVRKLPPVLAIQLKRFEYDYERVCAIKFNDYFEFPRMLDMEPYTVSGLAKIENEVIEINDTVDDQPATTKYQLTGIVVHSGQASGGHYFSYILHKDTTKDHEQWYKFDDGEVTECKMHEDEEMKAQCYGGDYMGEVYDDYLKRVQMRRQKRWWNAYMLFYTRCDQTAQQQNESIEQLSLAESQMYILPMPEPIEKSVRSQNLRFLQSRSFFSIEFFNFIKKLVSASIPSTTVDKLSPETEEISLLAVQLAAKFMFHSGLRTKKTLRGPANDWYDIISAHIRHSAKVRRWFAQNVILNPPNRLAEYILVAPSQEVRIAFVKLVAFCCLCSCKDEPLSDFNGENLCEQILLNALQLLKREVAENGKHLQHYFTLFSLFIGSLKQSKRLLLRLNIPALFMQVALDEGPGPPIKHQCPELGKLHEVVSILVRCTDISSMCQSSNTSNGIIMPNIYADTQMDQLYPLSKDITELLFNRTSYLKKLIEDTNVGEDGLKLLQYCSWENPHFSRCVLSELLGQCAFAYWHDMRHHTDLLLHILLMEDSWQHHRIHNALMGVNDEREGLLDTISRSKAHYQKRAYQIIKCLVQLFRESRVALTMLNTNRPIARSWTMAVEWLQDELERQRLARSQYNYSSVCWSPPSQSNENTNGYMLERSNSAINTLQVAVALCPEEEQEETNDSDTEQIEEPVSAENHPDIQQQQYQRPIEESIKGARIHLQQQQRQKELQQHDGGTDDEQRTQNPLDSTKRVFIKERLRKLVNDRKSPTSTLTKSSNREMQLSELGPVSSNLQLLVLDDGPLSTTTSTTTTTTTTSTTMSSNNSVPTTTMCNLTTALMSSSLTYSTSGTTTITTPSSTSPKATTSVTNTNASTTINKMEQQT